MNYDLRLKLTEMVHAGLLDRADYYGLVEVLAEAYHLLPAYRGEVEKANRLIGRLVELVGLTTEHGLGVLVPPADLTLDAGRRVGHIGHIGHIGYMGHVGILVSPELSRSTEIMHLLGQRIAGASPHEGPPAVDIVRHEGPSIIFRHESERPAPEFYSSNYPGPAVQVLPFQLREQYVEAAKDFPKPTFKGYHGKQRGKKKGRS